MIIAADYPEPPDQNVLQNYHRRRMRLASILPFRGLQAKLDQSADRFCTGRDAIGEPEIIYRSY